ncbi:zona pellucida sperm-binding protein 4-like isoform X1 [Dermochelys coriacea]|uniref:zona pellucida sperm-binding protein 4-like isoform X1 n=1 Tax=Dermochelys coriacea TaxID=27794 RepID=UPI001CA96F1F|nr:zona pellucida sperm-binding protein 4-like isoform X1 [Dermochelys coriacea]
MAGVWGRQLYGGMVCFWLLYYPFVLALGALVDPRELVCSQRSLQFMLPPGQAGEGSLALTAWDVAGKLHALQNDSSCGVWVSQAADGSRTVGASYGGCYVSEWVSDLLAPALGSVLAALPALMSVGLSPQDGGYLMVVGVEGMAAGGRRALHEEKVLRCPRSLPALDAPSPDVCAAIQSQDRLPCASPPIARGVCEEQGCCYNPSDRVKPCYYGNTVTAQCTPDGHFSLVVSRAVTLPPLILDSVHLANGRGAGCVPVGQNNAFVLFRFPLSACGTTFQMAGDQGVYENELVASRDVRTWSLGSITRDSTFRLQVRCSYSISGNFLPLSVQVFTLPPPPGVSQPGPLVLELRIATEQSYGFFYEDRDYPVVKLLQDPIYVEVRILQRTDPDLVLVLHQCWATPSTNPQQQPQWPILVDGCPYTGDNYRTQLVPVGATLGLQFPSHHQRFIIRTFTFMESASQRVLTGPVYLHCSASVCQPSRLEPCTLSCPAGARGKRSSEQHLQDGLSHITSQGPVFLLQARQKREVSPELGSSRNTGAAWILALAGVVLMGALCVMLMAIMQGRWRKQSL